MKFTPTDLANYLPTTTSVNVTIGPAAPTIFAQPLASVITYGQTLASSKLSGGSASTAGMFAFADPSVVPNAGTASQSLVFRPNDAANYSVASGSLSVTVNKALPTVITPPTASTIGYGQPLSASILSGGSASVGGTFAFSTPSALLNAGTSTQTVAFTPQDTANYLSTSALVAVIVTPPAPTINSLLTANGKVGEVFSYQISGTDSPKNFAAEGLPLGLNLDAIRGGISGAPRVAGTYSIALRAANDGGSSGPFTLVLKILPATPVINNTAAIVGVIGHELSYQMRAANDPVSFTATNLPGGLSLNPSTGVIAGTPTVLGSVKVSVTAVNEGGTGFETLLFNIYPEPPVVTSGTAATATIGKSFSYQIQGTNLPIGYYARGLPVGLTCSTDTGLISGVPQALGKTVIDFGAYNEGGTGTQQLVLNVVPPQPVLSGPYNLTLRTNVPFSYQIIASNKPTGYNATNLPAWLKLDTVSGALTGTPLTAGSVSLGLEASNEGGTGRATLSLVVTPQAVAPLISGQLSVVIPVNVPFQYTIQASNVPTKFTATNLPAGLALDAATGIISGTPTVPGTSAVVLGASNEGGSSNSPSLQIKVLPSAPVINSELAATASALSGFRYQITASNQPTRYDATGLPSGLAINKTTGMISGTPQKAGTAAILITASNEGGDGAASLQLTVLPAAPVLNVPAKLTMTAGMAFSYQLVASNVPMAFSSDVDLPAGVSLNTSTGLISGTPTEPGVTTVRFKASNEGGFGTSSVDLTVLPSRPVFTTQPLVSTRLNWGATTTLSASARAIPAPSWQWKKDGVVLDGATLSTLAVGPLGTLGTTRYTVVATNAAGSTESNAATVEQLGFSVGLPALTVAGSSALRGLVLGSGFVLSGSFSGVSEADATFQWKKDGVNVLNGTGVTFAKDNATVSDAGTYTLVVSAGGAAVSSAALRVVQGTPQVRVTPSALTAVSGGTARFSASLLNGTVLAGVPTSVVWKFNDAVVGTGWTLNLSGLARENAGVYEATVSATGYGSTTERTMLQVSSVDITTQPVGALLAAGSAFVLRVTATGGGSSGLVYQWRRDGVALSDGANVSGANTATLTLGSVSASLAGGYDVLVSTQINGETLTSTSATASVRLLTPVTINTTLFSGQARKMLNATTLQLDANVSAGTPPLAYQWYRLDHSGTPVALTDGASGGLNVSGARTSRVTIAPSDKTSNAAGIYKVLVTNGSETGSNNPTILAGSRAESGTVAITALLAPPSSLLVSASSAGPYAPDTAVVLTVSGTGSASDLRYQWRRNGVSIANAKSSSYTVVAKTTDQAGLYDVIVSNDAGSTTATAFNLELAMPPAVLVNALDPVTIMEGTPLLWTGFSATGYNLKTEWSRPGGLPASASTLGGTLRLASAGTSDSGLYTVRAYNDFSEATSTSQLKVYKRATLTSSLSSKTANPGQAVSFQITATGGDMDLPGGGLKYQWLRDGQSITGAASPIFALPSVSSADDQAKLAVRVYLQDPNSGKVLQTITSGTATLTVRQPVQLTAQPDSLSAELNATASFSVTATGSDITYQWRKDGVAIAGGTGASLSVKATETAGGAYSVLVKNAVNSVTSSDATLTVKVPASLTSQPTSKAVNRLGTVVFRVTAKGVAPIRYQWRKDGVPLVDSASVSGCATSTLTLLNVDTASEGDYTVVVANGIGTPEVSSTASLTINNSVTLTSQPLDRTVVAGGSVNFAVEAVGKGLRYQWRRNGVVLPGAVNSVLTLSPTALGDAGDYDALVSSGAVEVVSQSAHLEVFQPLKIISQPSAVTNLIPDNEADPRAAARLLATASGGGPLKTWEWFRNGVSVSRTTSSGDTSAFDVDATDDVAFYKTTVTSGYKVTSTRGLQGVYYASKDLTNPVLVRFDETINFNWAGGSPHPLVPAHPFSARWTGQVIPAVSGTHTFYTQSDDGVRLWVNGKQLINNWTLHPSREDSGTIELKAGEAVDIKLEYYEDPGVAVCKLSWSAPGLTKQIIPAGRLRAPVTGENIELTAVKASSSGAQTTTLNTQTSSTLAALELGSDTSIEVPVSLLQKVRVTADPQSVAADAGSGVSLRLGAQGGGELLYGWERERGGRWSTLTGVNVAELALSGLRQSDAGQYRATVSNARGSATSAAATLTVREVDVVTKQPLATTVNPSDTASFNVGASGVSLTYQWRKNGVAIPVSIVPSAATSRLVLSNVSNLDAGLYDVVVNHAYGTSVSASAQLSVNLPPSITVSPLGGAVKEGSRLTLFVKATGTEPLSYHWRKNGVVLAGASDADSFTLSGITPKDAGSYDVVVENVAGSQTSLSAAVSVPVGVTLTQQPVSQTVLAGASVKFTVTATGTPKAGATGLAYRWRKGGVELVDDGNISGSATDTLSIAATEGASGLTLGSGGNYDVVVSNDVNSVTSVPATLVVNTAPLITVPPASLSAKDGEEVRFTVTAIGASPLSYEWFHIVEGKAVSLKSKSGFSGGTSAVLVIKKANGSDTAGSYYALVTNPYGQVKSPFATLSQLKGIENLSDDDDKVVVTGSSSAVHAALPTGVPANARVIESKEGLPLSLTFTSVIPSQDGVEIAFQWRRNGLAIADGGAISGATTRTLSIASLTYNDAGVYDLQVSALSGGAEKSRATVRTTLVTILQPPLISGMTDLLVRPGQNATFEPLIKSAVSGGSLSYQWLFNGKVLSAQTSGKLALSAVSKADEGDYTVCVTDSIGTSQKKVTLSVAAAIAVTSLPQKVELDPRSRFRLDVSATPADATIRYQWRYNGVPIRGAVAPQIALSSVSGQHAGRYDVVVSNGYERVTSNQCELVINEPWQIVTQPKGATVNQGEPLGLSVALNRSGAVSYQWYKGVGRAAQLLPDQSGPMLNIAQTKASDQGVYFALITTNTGRLTSALARVVIDKPVAITQQPQGASVRPGAAVTFATKATGSGVLSYQWTRNGAPVAGANGPELTLSAVASADSGTYQVLVRNAVSVKGVLSEPAVLQVASPAVFLTQPADSKAVQGGSVSLSVVVNGEGESSYQWRRNGVPITGATTATLSRANVSVLDTGYYDCVVHSKLGALDLGDSVSRRAFVQVFEPVTVLAVPGDRRVATTGTANRAAAFRVVATGTAPLVFTWTKLATDSTPETVLTTSGDTLSFLAAGSSDLGSYRVAVSGPAGDVVTTPVFQLLDAWATPVFKVQPAAKSSVEGKSVVLTATAPDGYVITKWRRLSTGSGSTILDLDSDGTASAATTSLTLAGVAATGYYQAVASPASGSGDAVLSNPALVYINLADPLYPAGFRNDAAKVAALAAQQYVAVSEGGVGVLRVFPVGEGLTFAWTKNGGSLPAGARGADKSALSLYNVTPQDAGEYVANVLVPDGAGGTVSVQSVPFTLVVQPLPKILADPAALQTLLPGATATLSIAAEVTADTKFQWYFRKAGTELWVPVPGASAKTANGSTCYVRGVQKLDEGEYRVEVSNAAGTVSSGIAVVNVLDPLVLKLEALGGSVNPGGTLTLQASMTGSLQDAGSLQFYKQSRTTSKWELVAEQVSGSLTLSNLQQSDETSYKVRAYGKVNGLTESPAAKVVVNDPVVFSAGNSVSSLTLAKGDSTELRVLATGYQLKVDWYFKPAGAAAWGSTPVSSGSSTSLVLASVRPEQAGTYGVVLRNDFSHAATANAPREVARVMVNAPPSVTMPSTALSAPLEVSGGGTLSIRAEVRDTTAGRVYYTWRLNGRAISGASDSVYISAAQTASVVEFNKSAVSALEAGYYDLLVSNSYGAALGDPVRVVVNSKPTVTMQAQTVLASVGGSATFRVDASGTGDFTYQWWRRTADGAESIVPGGTQKVLIVRGVTEGDDQSKYWVVVNGVKLFNGSVVANYGTTISAEALLTVAQNGAVGVTGAPLLTGATSPILRSGAANLTLVATGTESTGVASVTTRWRKDGVVVQTRDVLRSADGNFTLSYSLPMVGNDSDGLYDVVVDNGVSFASSPGLQLSVDPKIDGLEVPATANPGDGVKASVTVRNSSGGGYSYVWYKDGAPISNDSIYAGATTSELTLKAVPANWQGEVKFSVLVTNTTTGATMSSAVRTLLVTTPISITTQPLASTTTAEGGVLRLSVVASGGGVLTYQWLKDGSEIVGETNASLARSSAAPEDGGLYQVRISNAAGSVLSDIAKVLVQTKLSVSLASLVAVPLGGPASFVAQVRGSANASLSFEWTLNGVVIAGAQGDQYRVASSALIDVGSYAVSVTRKDTGEKVSSNVVYLEVKKVPVIVVPPVSRTVVDGAGNSVIFSVAVRSDEVVSYQWLKGGSLLANGTSSTLKLSAVTLADAGMYTVQISNQEGTVEASARLSVLPKGTTAPSNPTAGSSDTGLAQTSWWVYWASATHSLSASVSGGVDRKGYWLLERRKTVVEVGGKTTTVVTPGRALWIWGSSADLSAPLLSSDEWAPEDETVQDGVASDRSEFSVVASRVPTASYALSGRVETVGEAALYGAPETALGVYDAGTGTMDVDLSWDGVQVSELDGLGSPTSLRALVETMQATLLIELGSISGE